MCIILGLEFLTNFEGCSMHYCGCSSPDFTDIEHFHFYDYDIYDSRSSQGRET